MKDKQNYVEAAKQNVVILGASNNPERYAYKAFKMLNEYGHYSILVNPKLKDTSIDNVPVVNSLGDVKMIADTLTIYVNPEISTRATEEILRLLPRRVIFNPGTENAILEDKLKRAGIHVVRACTLVLLRTGQFDRA